MIDNSPSFPQPFILFTLLQPPMASSSADGGHVRAKGTKMRTTHRVVRTDAQPLLAIQGEDAQEVIEADGEMWQEQMRAMWSQMTKQELEEEVHWRSDDQTDLAECVKYLQAELTKQDEDIKSKTKISRRQTRRSFGVEQISCASTMSSTGRGPTSTLCTS